MKELVIAIQVWVAAMTGTQLDDIPEATIKFVPQEQLEVFAQLPEGFAGVAAFYRATEGNGTIYLPDHFRWESTWYQSLYVHELVHHYQVHNPDLMEGDMRRCAREAMAYDIQARYLALWDVDLLENDGSRPSAEIPAASLQAVTNCDHPFAMQPRQQTQKQEDDQRR